MCLREVRLQTKRFHCRGPRFFLSRRRRIEIVVIPIVDPGQCCKCSGEVWIEFRCFFKELLSFFCIAAELVSPIKHLVCRLLLEKKKKNIICHRYSAKMDVCDCIGTYAE